MKSVAIVGYGLAGKKFHAYLIGLVPGLRVLGFASTSEEKREEIRAAGLRAWKTLDEAAGDPDVDLVVIATPHHLHCEQAVRALEKGKHVVVDKIMALSVEEADRMIGAARRADRILTVFQNRRFDDDYLTVRKAIHDDLLGEVIAIESAVSRFKPPRGWRSHAVVGGGLFNDWGAHLIDQLVQLFGSSAEVVFCDFRNDLWSVEVETHAHAIIRFRRGPTAVVEISHASRIPKPRWLVRGTAGTLAIVGLDPQEDAMLAGDIAAARRPADQAPLFAHEENGRTVETRLPMVPGCWTAFYENLARVLHGDEDLLVRPEGVREGLSILQACRRSAWGKVATMSEGTELQGEST